MMHFTRLDDSPMFRKQLQTSEESAEALRERCLKFYKGCRKYTEGLGEAYDQDIAFASALESFGGGHDDPISVAVGGPVMAKFTITLREIGTYKEVLRSQVEHMLNDRLMQFVNIDLQDVKEVRKRFDKTSIQYDQAREKFLSLKKGTKPEIIFESEENLRNARSSFEQARFNLVTALSNIESKKKFEFLESVSGTMDAHLRYFKQGYELFLQMEPYIHQVLTFAHQSRERANYEQAGLADKMQEYRRQMESEYQHSLSDTDASLAGDGIQTITRSSHKIIEAAMQSTPKGKVQTIKQGYLLKRSSSLRSDWKRRYFVLDSRGVLYYYRKQWGKPSDEKTVAHHTVNLLTSTIKVDAEQSELRFCFRIISPSKVYTLQAENVMEQMDWVDKITGVITSLLNSQTPEQLGYSQRFSRSPGRSEHQRTASESSSFSSSSDFDHSTPEDASSTRSQLSTRRDGLTHIPFGFMPEMGERPIDILRRVAGNEVCADCNSSDPDWASLNLGILVCIECSGVHRNLGVHISKVRSLTLDVKVWEPSVINLFQSVGNEFANSVWEELLQSIPENERNGSDVEKLEPDIPTRKPDTKDPLSIKEKYIYSKYVEKKFVLHCLEADPSLPSVAYLIWNAVQHNNKQETYRLIITMDADVNTTYEEAMRGALSEVKGRLSLPHISDELDGSGLPRNEEPGKEIVLGDTEGEIEVDECDLQGSTLLYLACTVGDLSIMELLLQYGAKVNYVDSLGRTPLHHCILRGRYECAKLLLARGANASAVEKGGKTALQIVMEMGAITDEELFLMLSEAST